MYPRKLLKQHKYKRVRKGVYDVTWGAKQIRVIVLSEVPQSKKNALWNIFSNVKKNIEYGVTQYRTTRSGSKLTGMSSVIDKVFEHYGVEGLYMAYTMEQFQKDHLVRKLPQFFDDTKVQDGIFQTISNNWTVSLIMDKLRSVFSVKDIVSSLSPDERLEGLSEDEVQAYLQKLKQTSDD